MPGEIVFTITGDITALDKEIDRVEDKRKKLVMTAKDAYDLILQHDNIVGKQVDRTTQLSTQRIVQTELKAQTSLEFIEEQTRIHLQALDSLTVITNQIELDSQTRIEKAKRRLKEFELQSKMTVTNTLFILRSVSDSFALLSAVTGQQINTQFLSLISMGLSSAMQVQMQAAIYSATPGGQPFALMLLAMLPMLTGMINFFQAEQMRLQQQVASNSQAQLDEYLDGLPS